MLSADVIICEYKLPLPESLGSLSDVKWDSVEFSTISFQGFQEVQDNEYLITEQGQLYKYDIIREWVEDKLSPFYGEHKEKSRKMEKLEHTGEIDFACYFVRDSDDYIVHFNALFFKGELQSLTLKDWKGVDNAERIQAEDDFKLRQDKYQKIRSSFWFPAYCLFRKVISTMFFIMRYFVGWMVKLSWRLERLLTPL